MKNLDKWARTAAIAVIWVLIAIGVAVGAGIPFVATALVKEFGEYASDFGTITTLLMIPDSLAIALLVVILVLLRRIRVDQIMTPSTYKWVRALTYVSAALALSFVAIFGWLIYKNTLPPSVAIVLILGVLLPLAVSLVTRTLLGLLQKATQATEELEGVI